jgi:glutamate racemase
MTHIRTHIVGFIDSGWGGMTIRDATISMFPDLATIYIADHAFMPYGTKEDSVVHERVVGMIRFLIDNGAQMIVIACNTASVSGIDEYRRIFPEFPIIAVVPVVKTASEMTKAHAYTLFATEKTADSAYVQNLIDQYSTQDHVTKIGSKKLASLIEKGDVYSQDIHDELVSMASKIPSGNDVIVLGCTHYPYISKQLEAIIGQPTRIIDSSGAVSRHVGRTIAGLSSVVVDDEKKHRIYTTDEPGERMATLQKLTGRIQIVERALIP